MRFKIISQLLLLIFPHLRMWTQLVAGFSSNTQAICQGECINFINQSSGPIVTWNWNFPGGTPSSFLGPNPPPICYQSPGIFDVLLVVSNGLQIDSIRIANYIVVAQTPTLSFQTLDASCPGLNNGMAAATLSGGTGNYSFLWSPGGQTTASLDSLAPGIYHVTASDNVPVSVMHVLYEEDFSDGSGWTLNQPTGPNDADANFWVISDAEGGLIAPACGVAFNGNPTLHVTSTIFPNGGAAYNAGGLCPGVMCVNTNRRAESQIFSTSGYNNVFISFHYIMTGQVGLDYAELFFFDGVSWQPAPLSIPITPTCIGGQGLWSLYSAPLPPNCQNNPNVRIGFNWKNNDDGLGTDPSFAVDNIKVYNLTTQIAQCTITDSVIINQNPGPQLTFSFTNPGCTSTNNGSITAQVQNSSGGLSYQWTPSQTNSPTINNLTAGTYILTVYDTISGGVAGGGQVVWSDDFEGPMQWILNVPFGPNDPDGNYWIISDAEGGMSSGSCAAQFNGNKTLHITNTLTNGGALYNAGGLCPWLMCVTSHVRAESVPISTIGFSDLTLQFDFIAMGQSMMDESAVWYNNGTGWNMLTSLQSNLCAASQGLWTQLTLSLPSSCENIPNLQIGFTWRNNDDGLGADPSVAINDVYIHAGASTNVSGSWVCSVTDTVTLIQLPLLGVDIELIEPMACGEPGILVADIEGTGGPFSITWNSNPPHSGDTLIVYQPGDIILTVSDTNGCTVQDILNLQPDDGVIQVQAQITQANCLGEGGTIDLTVSGASGSYNFMWSNNETTEDLSNLSPGVYNVQISSGGCSLDTSFSISTSPGFTIFPTLINPKCHGENSGAIKLNINGGSPPYQIFWNGQQGPASNYYLTAGSYQIYVIDDMGCDTTIIFTLADPPSIEVFSDTSHTIWMGESVLLWSSASGGTGTLNLNWSPNYYIECTSCPVTVAFPPRTTTYTIQYTDTVGCKVSREVEVIVVRDGPFIPTAFTPNGNDRNEEFRIIAYGVKKFELRIYDRWGHEVFFTDDLYTGWNGKFNGEEVPQGTYVYKCYIKYLNGDVGKYLGHIILYR